MYHVKAAVNASGGVVDVVEKIINLVKRLEDAFVKNIVNNVSVESDQKYNVVVMNLNLPEPARRRSHNYVYISRGVRNNVWNLGI